MYYAACSGIGGGETNDKYSMLPNSVMIQQEAGFQYHVILQWMVVSLQREEDAEEDDAEREDNDF